MKIVYDVPALGQGGYGKVYTARVLVDGNLSRVVALKKGRINNSVEHPCLLHEACGYVLNKGHPSIPEIFGWGRSQFYEYLAMELLGPDLDTRLNEEGLTRGNFVSLVLQMLSAVKHVHSCGILHCDIKPSNFVFGLGENWGRIYLIDFNLWTAYRHFNTGEHFASNCATRGFRGTCDFASINSQLDRPISRRDDVESLAYTIFHIYASELPWSYLSSENSTDVSKHKQVWRLTHLLHGNCEYPLGRLIEYAWSLGFDEDPDYDRWRREFWEVDNVTGTLPELDPMYDPMDTTEELPRTMDFITEYPPPVRYKVDQLHNGNAEVIIRAPGSNHGYIPASESWGAACTMLSVDTMANERECIRGSVECITEVPTTVYEHLAPNCPPEVMRKFDDPIPFEPADITDAEEGREET